MTLPIYKKSKFDEMENKQNQIAKDITSDDRKEITRLMVRFIKHKDARGAWQIPRKEGMQLLPYFQKYVDPNTKGNIFGCGGCAKKMVDYMFSIYKIWQNQTT